MTEVRENGLNAVRLYDGVSGKRAVGIPNATAEYVDRPLLGNEKFATMLIYTGFAVLNFLMMMSQSSFLGAIYEQLFDMKDQFCCAESPVFVYLINSYRSGISFKTIASISIAHLAMYLVVALSLLCRFFTTGPSPRPGYATGNDFEYGAGTIRHGHTGCGPDTAGKALSVLSLPGDRKQFGIFSDIDVTRNEHRHQGSQTQQQQGIGVFKIKLDNVARQSQNRDDQDQLNLDNIHQLRPHFRIQGIDKWCVLF